MDPVEKHVKLQVFFTEKVRQGQLVVGYNARRRTCPCGGTEVVSTEAKEGACPACGQPWILASALEVPQ